MKSATKIIILYLYTDTGIVLCFGGGVLLSTVFIHMVAEVRESLESATTMGMIPQGTDFPFAECLICMGNSILISRTKYIHFVSNTVELLTHHNSEMKVKFMIFIPA